MRRSACDAPTMHQTSSASLFLTRLRPVPPPGEVAAPKAPQARCSPPGSAPSVRLEMTGSGPGGPGQRQPGSEEEEQLGSQAPPSLPGPSAPWVRVLNAPVQG